MQDSLSTSLLLIVGKEIDGTSIFIDRNPSPPLLFSSIHLIELLPSSLTCFDNILLFIPFYTHFL